MPTEQVPIVRVTYDNKIGYARLNSVTLVVYGPTQWDDRAWLEHLDQASELRRVIGHPPAGAITYIATATPTAGQRRIATEKIGGDLNRKVSVVTESGIARAGVNVMGMLLRLRRDQSELHAFRPGELMQAIAWLGPDAVAEAKAIRQQLCALMQQVGYTGRLIEPVRVAA